MEDALKVARRAHWLFTSTCILVALACFVTLKTASFTRVLKAISEVCVYADFPTEAPLLVAVERYQSSLEAKSEQLRSESFSLRAEQMAEYTARIKELPDNAPIMQHFSLSNDVFGTHNELDQRWAGSFLHGLRFSMARSELLDALDDPMIPAVLGRQAADDAREYCATRALQQDLTIPGTGIAIDMRWLVLLGPAMMILTCLFVLSHVLHVLGDVASARKDGKNFGWLVLYQHRVAKITAHASIILLPAVAALLCCTNAYHVSIQAPLWMWGSFLLSLAAACIPVWLALTVARLNREYNERPSATLKFFR